MDNFDTKLIEKQAIDLAAANMPVTKSIFSANEQALKGYIVLHINHTLADVYAFNELLVKSLGCELYFVGVPYSNKFIEPPNYHYSYSFRGNDLMFVPFENGKQLDVIKPQQDYIELLKFQIKHIIETYILPKINLGAKFLIIQDGGYTTFIRHSNKSYLNTIDNFIGIVEQTSSGTGLFEKSYLLEMNNYPTISIAKSEIKASVEARFICDSIFNSIHAVFKKMGLFLNYKCVYISGYGIIGRSLAHLMRNIGIHVKIIEIDPLVISLAEREGFLVRSMLTRDDFEESLLYLGCTGVESFTLKSLEIFLKSNCSQYHLASGSSKRVEFWPIVRALEQNWETDRELLMQINPFLKEIETFHIENSEIGLIYVFTLSSGVVKKLYLLGEGFPINFSDKNNEGIPNRAIDLTQSALVSATLTLVENTNIMENRLYYYKHKNRLGNREIDEEIILRQWLRANKINLSYSNPLEHFNPHPLRGYFLEKSSGLMKSEING